MKTKATYFYPLHFLVTFAFSFFLILSSGNISFAQDASMSVPFTAFTTNTVNSGAYNQVVFTNNGAGASSSSYTNCTGFTTGNTLRIDNNTDNVDITTANSTIQKIDIRIQANSTTATNLVIAFSTNGTTWSNFQELSAPATNANPSCNLHTLTPPAGMKYFRAMRTTFGGYVPVGTVGSTVRIFSMSVFVNVTGPPSTQASNINFSGVSATGMTANWTRGDGSNVAVFAKESAGAITNPSDASTYTASTTFGSGTQLGTSGYYCVYNGTGTSVSVTGMNPSSTYHFQAFEYNGSGTGTQYNTATATNNPNSQATSVAAPTINVTPASLSFNSVKINTNSTQQSYSLSAAFLSPASGNITVTPPSGYQVSTTSGSGFGSSLSIPYTGSTLSSTTIYVRFSPTAVSSYNGDITNVGGSASQNVALTGAGVLYAVGEYGSFQDGNWSTAATWKLWDGSGFNTTAGSAPGSTSDVNIIDGKIVTVTASTDCKNLYVQSGQVKANNNNPTATQTYIRMANGGVVSVTGGILGNNQGDPETALGLQPMGTMTITGSGGTARISRIRPDNSGTTNYVVNIDRDITFTYPGSTGTGGSALYAYNSSASTTTTFTLNVNAGKTITFVSSAYLATGASSDADANVDATFNINGTITYEGVTNNNTTFRVSAGKTCNVTVGSTGTLNLQKVYVGGTGGSINIVNDGVINFGYGNVGTADFSNSSRIITGTGTTNILSGSTFNISSTTGLASSGALGHIQTTTRSFSPLANYTYLGTVAQVTGDGITGANNLTINNSAGVAVSSNMDVSGTLSIAAGALDLNGKNIVLKSGTYPNTAIVSAVSGSINHNGGSFTTERSIPMGNRGWRQMASGVTTTNFIRANWQNDGVNTPGIGTHITGSTSGANGFDQTTVGDTSMATFDPFYNISLGNRPFVFISNTDATNLNALTAYRLFIRGDRTAALNVSNPTQLPPGTPVAMNAATTLKATGTLMTGTQTFSGATYFNATADSFAFIPNPYWSPVDFELITRTNINPTYWVFDPNIGHRGAYVSYTIGTGTSNGGSDMDKYIQPGQAIFVQTTATGPAPSVEFNENDKANSFTTTFRLNPSDASMLNVILKKGTMITDGTTVAFKNDFSASVGIEDAIKFNNPDENISIVSNSTQLGIEGRPNVVSADTISLRLWKLFEGNHELKFKAENFDAEVSGYVWDKYTNQMHALNMAGEVSVPFTFTATDSASFYNRFYVVFRNSTTLPVSITSVKAYQKNTGVQVEWNVASENNINKYEVEKSGDGRAFATSGTVAAKGNNNSSLSYNWFDAQPISGANYYRVKAVERSGAVKYTSIVKVNIGKGGVEFTIYPNPVKGKEITVSLNTSNGDYTVEMYNAAGQKVKSERVQHGGGSAAYTITLPNVAAGVYTIRLFGKDINTQQSFIIEN